MAKRPNRVPPIEHEQRQIENLKTMVPNTTPEKYKALSDGLADVAVTALDLIAALECDNRPDFERLYDLVDGLADLVDGEAVPDEPQAPFPLVTEQKPQVAPITRLESEQRVKPAIPAGIGVTTIKTTIVGRPDSVSIDGDTVTLKMSFTPKPGATGYSFPKGVPEPVANLMPVMAYVGKKQFEKVKGRLDDPDDSLIIEGAISQVVGGVLCVYASNITSKLIQAEKTAAQKAAAQQQLAAQTPES